MKIIIALLIFSIIIIFHELGHFSLAKANGIRVNEFCLTWTDDFGRDEGRNEIFLKTASVWRCLYDGGRRRREYR